MGSEMCIRDRSYYVKTRQGKDLIRGRRLIRPAPTATLTPVLSKARRLQTFIMSSSSQIRSSSSSGGARGASRRNRDPSWSRGSTAVPPLSVNLRDIRSAHHVCFSGGMPVIKGEQGADQESRQCQQADLPESYGEYSGWTIPVFDHRCRQFHSGYYTTSDPGLHRVLRVQAVSYVPASIDGQGRSECDEQGGDLDS